MRTTSNIIGISAFFHDAAACLLCDGKLVAAASEERFSRIKHDPSLPVNAVAFCLKKAGLSIADIDCIAYYEDPAKKMSRQLWMISQSKQKSVESDDRQCDPQRAEREIRTLLQFNGPIEYVDHHLSHAASSFFFSGFEDAAIFTVDGVGEWATTAYGRGSGASIALFEEVHFPNSLGLLYTAITTYLGFSANESEYKVMGLAPYGRPKYLKECQRLVQSDSDIGRYHIDMSYFDFLGGDRMYSDRLCTLFGQPARARETEVLQFHKDVARSIQVVLEEILIEKSRYLRRKVDLPCLCMAGGVALNCVANGRILRESGFEKLFVQPAADDSGGALGAAAMAYALTAGKRPCNEQLRDVRLGPVFSQEDIARRLRAMPLRFLDFNNREDELAEYVAGRLAAGEIVGWFQGAMEFGPRALGARSILADPRDPCMRDRVNALVKKREAFRPFAPSVLAHRAHEHFDLDVPSPFMLLTCQVRSRLDLPAITHVDGSARVQTVTEENEKFYRLLTAFETRTGCPILLNTSFNVKGEPIVCNPTDAIVCFVRANLDLLVIENFVILGADIPEIWRARASTAYYPPPAVPTEFYTFW
jgi:carbamoyltransferase